jgi:hypothetical protein
MCDDWRGGATGDQYFVDTESRYPIFSDINNNDYLISNPITTMKVAKNKSEGISTSIHPKLSQPIRHKPTQCKCCGPKTTAQQHHFELPPNYESVIFLFVFLFIVLIIICCFGMKSIIELKSQIKFLQYMMKRETKG